MTGPIYNAVRRSNGSTGSTAVRTVSPTGSNFSGTTANTISRADLKDATRHRKGFAVFTAFLFGVALIFLLLINIGNVSNVKVLNDLWFFKIDVSKIVPAGGANGGQARSAQSVGLRDFYQVGLWNFCEGYHDKGITQCSKPVLMYWFNPVQIMVDEVLKGESGAFSFSPEKARMRPSDVERLTRSAVALPQSVADYLTTVRNASHLMFLCFFGGLFAALLSIFLCPLAVYSRLASIPVALVSLATGLGTLIAAAISSAMWAILRRNILDSSPDLNITAEVGTKMAVFAWSAAACTMVAAFGQLFLLCCGTSRRDIKTGRRVGRKERHKVAVEENPALRRRWWGSVST